MLSSHTVGAAGGHLRLPAGPGGPGTRTAPVGSPQPLLQPLRQLEWPPKFSAPHPARPPFL